MRTLIVTALITVGLVSVAPAAENTDWMAELVLGGRKIEGRPLAWDQHWVHLLGRDGRHWEFRPNEATEFRKISDRFRSYSVSQIRAMLLEELGSEYQVTGTTHYLVAHPRGKRSMWPQRFDELYRSFVHYFSVRGWRIEKPPFPLIGIVCKDQADFRRRAAAGGSPVPSGVLGYYELDSNRILLYDMGGREGSAAWQETASVIVHEATHQTAFNTGVHSRWARQPLWVVEGLATMFEAPGIYDSRHHRHLADRVNRGRFEAFRAQVEPQHTPELLSSIVASDRLFRTSPSAAYAEAWALSFYLVETQPSKYVKYLGLLAQRPAFTEYAAAERTADFAAVFGKNWPMLEARFLRFMAGVK